MGAELGLVACETVVPELEAVVAAEGRDDVVVLPFVGGCMHHHLAGAPEAADPEPGRHLPTDLPLHHIRCGTCPRLPLPATVHDRIAGHRLENCFQLFLPAGVVAQHLQAGAYLATSGWLANWEEHLARQGLTASLARELFGEFARRVVLVDTGIRPGAKDDCRAFSRCLDLPWTTIDAGLDLTTLFVREILAQAERQASRAAIQRLEGRLQEERANADLLLDLQRELSGALAEPEVLARIAGMCATLYAPGDLLVATWRGGRIQRLHPVDAPAQPRGELADFLGASTRADHRLTADRKGFMIRFRRGDTVNGGIRLGRFAFPENRDAYLNQALALAPVCELVISRARALQGILPVCSHCHQIRDSRGQWRRFEEYITSHSDALFSHSVCPACLRTHYPEISGDDPPFSPPRKEPS
jgi:hypothetical protein